MNYKKDKRIILSLDAGGTNFVFNAIRGGEELLESIILSAKGDNLENILETIIKGFEETRNQISEEIAAISFCFPGPADYEKGIIGDLQNLPAFRGGVALKAMLENHFHIPVFINNDGDLFAYGEAIAGLLPEVNSLLKENGSEKQYKNLLGVTFGTGFGGGIIINQQLFIGDNSAMGEINRISNKFYPQTSSEDSLSIRAIMRVFAKEAKIELKDCPTPKEIFEIGTGKIEGNKTAAIKTFDEFALVAGNVLADAATLLDSLIVIGGGLSGAYPLFLQKAVREMNKDYSTLAEEKVSRMEIYAYNLENKEELSEFMKDNSQKINVPFSDKTINYDPVKSIGVGISRLGTSKAVSVGAYCYALSQLDW
ncbi:MAG: ROK family protein [Bacteroidales bacterium]|nr:ROK family protein [Bacteroidales bacterium]